MSVDVFFMRFVGQEVQPVPFNHVRTVLERCASVTDDGIVTFDGEEVEQTSLEIDCTGMFQQLLIPRCQLTPRFQECAYALLNECGLCMFDESLDAIYAVTNISDEIPTNLLDQMANGLVLVARPDQIGSG